MPTIAVFFGMVITMYWDDHPPPHFHVRYKDHRAVVGIEKGHLLHGALPAGATRALRDWTERHRDELMANWARAEQQVPLWPVQGADEDE